MNSKIFLMKCVTNLHAGSGDANYGVIDNQVQRDPVTGYPTIFSSGIKGAIREYVRQNYLKQSKTVSQEDYIKMFGSEPEDVKTKKEGTKPGILKFSSAQLLAIPMRVSKGTAPFAMVTSKAAIEAYASFCELLSVDVSHIESLLRNIDRGKNYRSKDELSVEGIPAGEKNETICEVLEPLIHCNSQIIDDIPTVIMDVESFREKMKYLPVAARNRIENSKSKNLWYEEFVPHESVFWFSVMCGEANNGMDEDPNRKLLESLTDIITNNKLLQFGADATIGDGLVLINQSPER